VYRAQINAEGATSSESTLAEKAHYRDVAVALAWAAFSLSVPFFIFYSFVILFFLSSEGFATCVVYK
jgi:hypothetical protein